MPYRLSPSSLKLLDECARCFYLDKNKGIKRPSTSFPGLPNGMDRILKNYFDHHRDQGTVPPALADLEDVALFADKKRLHGWQNARNGSLFWTDEKGNTLRGGVDYLAQRNGKLIVLDYKTRGTPIDPKKQPEYSGSQLNIYNFLLRKLGYQTEDSSFLLFYHPTVATEGVDANITEVSFKLERVAMQISVEDAAALHYRAVSVLEGKLPASDPKCGFCTWADKSVRYLGKGNLLRKTFGF